MRRIVPWAAGVDVDEEFIYDADTPDNAIDIAVTNWIEEGYADDCDEPHTITVCLYELPEFADVEEGFSVGDFDEVIVDWKSRSKVNVRLYLDDNDKWAYEVQL